jgi:hypothetical protein
MPTARAGAELLASYSLEELVAIRRFLDLAAALALQQRMTKALLERERAKVVGAEASERLTAG